MPRKMRFVPVCEALEERRVLSSSKFAPPGLSIAESRSQMRADKTHNPPGQAVAALHRNNFRNDSATPATPVQTPVTTPNVVSTPVGQVRDTVTEAAKPLPQSTPVLAVELPSVSVVVDIGGTLEGTIDFAFEQAEHATQTDSENAEVSAPAHSPMFDLTIDNDGAEFLVPLATSMHGRPHASPSLAARQAASPHSMQRALNMEPVGFAQLLHMIAANDGVEHGDYLATAPFGSADDLAQGVRQFLDQLDDVAGEITRSVADSPYLTWCVALGVSLTAGEMARRLWKRQQMRTLHGHEGAETFWAPGLPHGING